MSSPAKSAPVASSNLGAPSSHDAGRSSLLARPASLASPPQKRTLTGSRLQRHADYQRAYAGSRKRQSSSMSWFLALQTPAFSGAALPVMPRVGLTAGKVLGKAHERNRIKRRMRNVLRCHVALLPTGFDLILHPRRVVMTLEFTKLEAEIVRILQQAQVEAERMRQSGPDRPVPRGRS